MSSPSPAPLRRVANQSEDKRYLHILLDLNDLKQGGSHKLINKEQVKNSLCQQSVPLN